MKRIHRVAVLGAGTMGARIAAHFANAGVPSYLLDIVPPDADVPARNKIAAAGLEAAKKSKPAAFMDPSLIRLVTIGNFEDDLKKLADVDWIIEAVVENLEIKRELLKKVEAIRKPGTIITTNTSGLPVAKIAEGFSDEFRRSWFGTHFFNPPRYMRLLELIPTPDTDRAAIEAIAQFCDVRLGKGVVFAKDTPNFIANRIGTFSVLNVMRLMQEMDLTVEDVDALTGQAVGWPRSATFRTIDLVGLDILGHVVANMTHNVRDERSDLKVPVFFRHMLERKWLGDKTKGGFYKKTKGHDGEEEQRLALDWKTLEYHPRHKSKFPVLEMAKNIEQTGARIRMLLGMDGAPQKADKAGQFLWTALSDLWTYAANRIPEISDSVVEIDRAMRLGFNWELGPFELWDAAGVEATVARMKREGRPIAANVEKLLACGRKSWYLDDPHTPSGRMYSDLDHENWKAVQVPLGVWSVEVAKKSSGVVKKNSGASLVDLGDGVACIEFHSKMNALGADIIQLISQTLKPGGPGDNFDAFVITNDATNFSVGANLMLLLMSIQEDEWDDIDFAIRQFQGMTQAIKFSPKPVVVAPFGLTLGGGTEISLHAPALQPHAELYTGLVEVGVGLLPGGGGCKEMLLRAVDSAESIRPGGRSESVELLEAMKKTFETIGTAKVATSAHEARALGFLRDSDRITMNRERLLSDAKERALEMVRAEYEPPQPRTDIPAPGENILATLKLGVHIMHQGG
ncbi:MAG TPA: 3-hydroxyacyl-CoA dehydrogenase NAD-binding domain-containing protein, partial [Terriglobales bacterium]|nr:3-hydroxyacyl-CoA dehydrogenase NAD-binding domain-containing protein [Terriglobales bacterium]